MTQTATITPEPRQHVLALEPDQCMVLPEPQQQVATLEPDRRMVLPEPQQQVGALEPDRRMVLPEPQQQVGALKPEQCLRALQRANEVRLKRAALKRRIAEGRISVADVINAFPPEAENWPVGELLMSQRRWGSSRTRRLLSGLQISETRRLGALTERQRRLLASRLGEQKPREALTEQRSGEAMLAGA